VRPGRRPTVRVLIGRSMIVYLLASAQREAWGVGGRGMAAGAAKSLRAVAGAEATTSSSYSRGFQISA